MTKPGQLKDSGKKALQQSPKVTKDYKYLPVVYFGVPWQFSIITTQFNLPLIVISTIIASVVIICWYAYLLKLAGKEKTKKYSKVSYLRDNSEINKAGSCCE